MDEYLDEIDIISAERQLAILKAQKKPKFRINRVPEELRLIPVYLDIEYGEYILRDSFQWNLNDQQISPTEYAERFVHKIGFGDAKSIGQQLLFQIMEFIEKHSFHHPQDIPQINKKIQSEKKRARQPRLQSTTKLTRLSFGLNKKCNNCDNTNIQSGQYCKKCKLPFSVTDAINCQDPITKACLLFYDIIQRKTQGVIEARRFVKEDFGSLYALKFKLLDQLEEKEMVEELFLDFMNNKDSLDQIELAYSKNQKGRPKKKVKKQKEDEQEQEEEEEQSQEQESEEENENEDEQKQEVEEEEEDGEGREEGSKEEESQQSEEEVQIEECELKPRIRTRRVAQEEQLRRSVRKRR